MKITVIAKTTDTSLLEEILQSVSKDLGDFDKISGKVKEAEIPDYKKVYIQLKKLKQIEPPPPIDTLIDMKNADKKLHEIHNAKNLDEGFYDELHDDKVKWTRIQKLVEEIYKEEKEKLIPLEFIREQRNKDTQLAYVHNFIRNVVQLKAKIDLIVQEIENCENRITNTLNHLDWIYNIISRRITIIQIGERHDLYRRGTK